MSHIRLHAAYIETGDRFLPKYPAHWTIKPSRSLLRVHKRVVGDRHSEYPLLSLTLDGIKVRDVDSGKGKFPESFDTYQEVNPGDLVFCLFDMDETPRTVGLSPHRGMITGAYTVFKPTPAANVDFLYYYFLHHDSQKSLKPFYTGLRKVIQKGTFGSIRIATPEVSEQREIAEYLDRETTRIDSLIEKKTRFIELLKEKRQAVITNAVTKGLDPSVPMTESEIEWIGQTPKHWNIKKLKWSIKGCFNGVWGDEPNGINDLIVVRVADFNRHNRTVDLSNHTIRSIEPSARSNRLLQKNDLLIEKSGGGDNQPVGMVVIYDSEEPAVCSNFVARMPVAEGFDPYFINYLHQAIYATRLQIKSIKQSTGIQNLDSSSYLDELAPYPPFPEQIAIREFLIAECGRFDALLNKTNRSIELLREHRSALITAAVTGKIDVRKSK